MRICFTLSILSLMASFSPVFAQDTEGYVTTIPFTETFDDESHYLLGGTLPDGWATVSATSSEFATSNITDAFSGENFAMSQGFSGGRQDMLFTPMMQMEAGVEYTISFQVTNFGFGSNRNPSFRIAACSGQSTEETTDWITTNQTMNYAEWTQIEQTFTPAESGEYCIAVIVTAGLSSSGAVCIDDFSIRSNATDPGDPGEEWTPSIPYSEGFDDASHYSGSDYLPIGWYSSGEDTWFTASSNARPAISGSYYMVAPSTIVSPRQDIAYSPLLEMEAGVEYTVSFYLYMPGSSDVTDSFKFTVGQEQSYDMHETVLEEVNARLNDWTLKTYTFTPQTTGQYCFGFWACTEGSWGGIIAVENFRLHRTDQAVAPEASFTFGTTLNSIFTGLQTVFPSQEVRLINNTTDADSYEWSVSGSATISDATAPAPTITFTQGGNYTVTLRATGKGGTDEATGSLNITIPTTGEVDALQTTSDSDRLFQASDNPVILEDGSVLETGTHSVYYDYVVGVNPYYRAVAERFEVPEYCEFEISSVTIDNAYSYLWAEQVQVGEDEDGNPIYSTFDKDKEFTLYIYPEKDGKPDVANPAGQQTFKIEVLQLGNYPHYERVGLNLDSPITVKGTFYVALEFDELQIEPWDPNQTTMLTRSFIGLGTRVHNNGETSLYVRPEKSIDGKEIATPEYCRADEFLPALKGYSMYTCVWLTYGDMTPTTGVENITDNTKAITVYASLDGDNFRLVGLQDGCNVNVYAINGSHMFAATATGNEMIIPASGWTKGVYVITAGNNSIKVIK